MVWDKNEACLFISPSLPPSLTLTAQEASKGQVVILLDQISLLVLLLVLRAGPLPELAVEGREGGREGGMKTLMPKSVQA